mmetsp:Transcript_15157/g.36966  ORF Transcript_15157/g.36966 Transcript_15157/m.36966 type:complete len:268 (+) Transcript_15157:91-894(+)|eukprot:CAMPEP_0185184438 /NCGR_PEP_ID=MMETSP1140-20130426/2576_1 /TAXON_ID=298111 /ORGANISM="Pavlova sp., Strain CCMP459" /LENGTH=267 /DNA_ID=CAMNT_0027750507 /DNA_START=48 /DNA_END=851 /DNA_ORIENTATION=-
MIGRQARRFCAILSVVVTLCCVLPGCAISDFMFMDPKLGTSITICICAKCGSTSFMRAMYKSLTGKSYDGPGLHSFMQWHVPGVQTSQAPGDVHIHVVRDPYERYLSAFHSKIKCCPGTSSPCFQDLNDNFVPGILKLAGNRTASAQCMHLNDYARSLAFIYANGLSKSINGHFLPQHLLPCAFARDLPPRKTIYIRGTTSQLANILPLLSGFTFPGGPLRVQHFHRTPRNNSEYEITPIAHESLCSVARAEIEALRMDFVDNACHL